MLKLPAAHSHAYYDKLSIYTDQYIHVFFPAIKRKAALNRCNINAVKLSGLHSILK